MLAHVKRAAGRNSFDSTDASIGRAAVRGAIIGYFAVVALVGTLVFTTAGVGLGTALAVGAYVGIWGGPGWGGMMAAQVHADHIEAAERSVTRRGAEEAHRPDGAQDAEVRLSDASTARRARSRPATSPFGHARVDRP